jgi:hypothetical protein
MVMSAAERSNKAAFYEKAANDESAAPELRSAFARKANWLRIVARLQATQVETVQTPTTPRIELEALLFSPTRLAAARIKQWRLCNLQQKASGRSGAD